MSAEKYEVQKSEVDKLLENNFIREARYLVWVCNPVLDWREMKNRDPAKILLT